MNTEGLYPGQDLLHIGFRKGKSSSQHRKIQQRADLPGIKPTLRQPQQSKKALHQSTLLGKGVFGESEGNVSGPGCRAEHGFNQRRIVAEPRDEHPDIRRGKTWVTLERIEQAVVQHLDFTHRTMADVRLD